jgi:hypothetical protein
MRASSGSVLCRGSNALRLRHLAVLTRDNVVTNHFFCPAESASPKALTAESTAAIANLLAVASFPGLSASGARSVPPGDAFFAQLVFDVVCSLPTLFRIRFTVCHELSRISCLIRILRIVSRKIFCVEHDSDSLLSFTGRYGIALDNCGRLSMADGLTQVVLWA